MTKLIPVLLLLVPAGEATAQSDEDAFFIKSIYDKALTECSVYDWLTTLTKDIGGRLSGSPQAAGAIDFTHHVLDTLGLDSVWLQPCTVPHWVRGRTEAVRLVESPIGSIDLTSCALGNSGASSAEGLIAPVIEVQSLDEVEALGPALKGTIVFFNRPLDPTQLNTFSAYGGAVGQRGYGPYRAARQGAVAALVRSMTTSLDDIPHTGTTIFESGVDPIPAMAISTLDAELLSDLLKKGPVKAFVKTDCRTLPDKRSYNVVAEWRGSEKPGEIIAIGGHLDSWDLGEGAHDDGAGCMQSIAVLQILHSLGYQPKRTIRVVMFMNEENGLRGGLTYADSSHAQGLTHIAAIESDRGGFTPRGFTYDGLPEALSHKLPPLLEHFPLLEPYGLQMQKGGGGADISPLKQDGALLFGLKPDSQRYFDYHHTHTDTLETVNKRELELGAAAMAGLVYLIDKYGLE